MNHHLFLMASVEFNPLRNRLSAFIEDRSPRLKRKIAHHLSTPLDEKNIAARRIKRYRKIAEKQPGRRIGVAYGSNVSGISAYPEAIKQTAQSMIASSKLGFRVLPTFDVYTPLQQIASLRQGTHHTDRIDGLVLPHVTDVVLFDGWQNSHRARMAVDTANRRGITVHDRSSRKAVA